MRKISSLLALGLVLTTCALRAEPAPLLSIDPLSFDVPYREMVGSGTQLADRKVAPPLWRQLRNSSEIPLIVLLGNARKTALMSDEALVADNASLVQAFSTRATAIGMHITGALSHFPIVFGTLPGNRIVELASLAEVEAVQEDGPIYQTRVEGGVLLRADQLRTTYGANGAGIGVAVIDSGVDDSHPELSNRVVVQGDYTGTTNDGTIDGTGHGTAVASIIAGTSGGIAPNAAIWALKVFDAAGNSQNSWVLNALNAAYANRASFGGLHVINMSLGNKTENNSNCDAAYPADAAVVNALTNAGIAVFVASGNDAHAAGIAEPACLQNAISIGAVYDANIGAGGFDVCDDPITAADRVTCYSNSGAPLDLLAPSHCARAAKPGAAYDDCFGGTSAASPYAAGVAAQILSKKPTLSPAQLLSTLQSTGKPITDPFTHLVRPRIDALAAYQSLLPASGSCIRTATTACLLGNRFELRVTWQTAGGSGNSEVMNFNGERAESDQSAFLWFFAPENFEMGVKMVNACTPPFNAFWVFISGLTNQGYTVNIRDTQTGAQKTYSNPLGQLARTVSDVSAFSCP
jgi:subtilisin family serine protease